jgi:hypothetical protein
MIVIALVGSCLAIGVTLQRRSLYFQALADSHESLSDAVNLTSYALPGKLVRAVRIVDVDATGVDRARADWHAQLEAKYRAAARRPWLPLEPDPPEPK